MAKFDWEASAAILGLTAVAGGVLWLAIWTHRLHGNSTAYWLETKVQFPFGPRFMVVAGTTLAVVASVRWLIRKSRKV